MKTKAGTYLTFLFILLLASFLLTVLLANRQQRDLRSRAQVVPPPPGVGLCGVDKFAARDVCPPSNFAAPIKYQFADFHCIGDDLTTVRTVGESGTCRLEAELKKLADDECQKSCIKPTPTTVILIPTPTAVFVPPLPLVTPIPTLTPLCGSQCDFNNNKLCFNQDQQDKDSLTKAIDLLSPYGGNCKDVNTAITPVTGALPASTMLLFCNIFDINGDGLVNTADASACNNICLSCQKPPSYTTTPTPICIPRPSCLDDVPPCLLSLPIDGSWCPVVSPTPTPTSIPTLTPPPTLIAKPPSNRCQTGVVCDCNCDGKGDIIDFECWRTQFIGEKACTTGDFNDDGVCRLTGDWEILRKCIIR